MNNIIILDEYVETSWNGNNRKHYEALGYKFTGRKDTFTVKVEHLPISSSVKVNCQCPYCGDKRKAEYNSLMRLGSTACLPCAKLGKTKIGTRFGMLVTTSLPYMKDSFATNSVTDCLCDCGDTVTPYTNHLKSGRTTSCGCKTNFNNKLGRNNNKFLKTKASRDLSGPCIERDNYTCQCCFHKALAKHLVIHHLYGVSTHPELALELDNVITVCKYCHKDFHSSLGGSNIPCTPRDFYNFVKNFTVNKFAHLLRTY